jgi:CTP synthase
MSKYIFISGGVISGIGKGITAASIGFILKSYGLKICMIKADPYLNIDAGTMNPLEHGETYVLEDGFETDMDMGTYERFTGEMFERLNSMTGGAVFQNVLSNERDLAYDGKWVNVDYHVPREMIRWITEVSEKRKSDVTLVEIGGTVGELGNRLFLEANRVMQVKNPKDVIHVHLSYLPLPPNLGEMKSKPVQMSVKLLNDCGINPDFIVARSERGIDKIRRDKLSHYCVVPPEHVVSAPDVESIYQVPLNFERDKLGEQIVKSLGLKVRKGNLISKWGQRYEASVNPKRTIRVGMICKYYKSGDFDLKDSYVSVLEALKHAGWAQETKVEVEWIVSDDLEKDEKMQESLKSLDGIVVPQGWGSRGVEGKIKAIQIARENKIPYLGLCFGMQMAVIEFARNVLGLQKANSEEANDCAEDKVIHLMEEQKKYIEKCLYGGTIRLGAYPCKLTRGSLLQRLYKEYGNGLFKRHDVVQERHRHRYEFNNAYREKMEKAGLVVCGQSPDGNLVEAIELPQSEHPFFLGTQYHPELKSQFLTPHPLFMGFVKSCLQKKG